MTVQRECLKKVIGSNSFAIVFLTSSPKFGAKVKIFDAPRKRSNNCPQNFYTPSPTSLQKFAKVSFDIFSYFFYYEHLRFIFTSVMLCDKTRLSPYA